MLKEKQITKTGFRTWKTKTIATIMAIFAAVLLPQIFHAVGAVSGLGSALGEAFLPMHLAIILVGLLAGPFAGLAAGAISPLISFAIIGMPTETMLLFMIIELSAYGFFAGMLANANMNTLFKLLIIMIGGRLLRSLAVLTAIYVFSAEINISIIYTSVLTGLPGIALQLAIIPLIMFWARSKTRV